MTHYARSRKSPATWTVVAILLAIAILGTLWVPLYARSAPKLGPFPFFYWFQLIWVPATAVLCWICYLLLRAKRDGPLGTDRTGTRRPLCTSTRSPSLLS
jgi:cytochrome bd-type quinol oxidase subunit 2